MDFKRVDTIPWCESFNDDVILRLLSDGLPIRDVAVIDYEVPSNLLINWPRLKGFDPYSYFGCISLPGGVVPVDIGPIPRFKQRRIDKNERYDSYILETGAHCRRLSGKTLAMEWYAMPMFYEFPVQDEKTWESYKQRLDPKDPRRYPKDWEKDGYLQAFEEYDKGPTTLTLTGFYGFGAELMGIPNFNLAFYKNPGLVENMVSYWEYFTIETLREAVETLQNRIDMVFWWEDLAERHGPVISPRLYQAYLLPHYRKVTGFLNKNKINRIMMDSDGNIQPILDLVIEAGINGIWPLEVNAGMDIRTLKKRYGRKLVLAGNLDKREILKGGQAMQKEIDSKLPFMKDAGGCLVGLDHDVPTEFTLSRFKEYADYMKKNLTY